MKRRKRRNKNKLDIVSIIISLIFGAIWCFAGGILYQDLHDWRPIFLVSIYFGGLAVTLFICSTVCDAVKGFGLPQKREIWKALGLILAVFIVAGVFEFIYECNIKTISIEKDANTSAYIFLIDESGSMEVNDADEERYSAIKDVMHETKGQKNFCIYSFANRCKRITEMMAASEVDSINMRLIGSTDVGGGTAILEAIQHILNDIEVGSLQAGKNPRILLLTDGIDEFTQLETRPVFSRANRMNVSVSAVGFGGCDDAYLQNIADMTNGKFVHAQDASELSEAMVIVSDGNSDYQRNILNHREPGSVFGEIIYGAERVLFMIILGALFFFIKAMMIRSGSNSGNLILPHVIAVTLGALGIEVGMNIFSLPEKLMRLLLCICFSLVLTGGTREETDKEQDTLDFWWDTEGGGV